MQKYIFLNDLITSRLNKLKLHFLLVPEELLLGKKWRMKISLGKIHCRDSGYFNVS